MLKINETQPKKMKGAGVVFLFLSICAHVGFFYSMQQWSQNTPRHVTEPSQINFSSIEKEPEPQAPTKTEPEQEQQPKPVPLQESKPPKVVQKKVHKPNRKIAEQPPTESTPPAKPVFGATAASVGATDAGVSIRVGNTLSTEMEKQFTTASKVKPIAAASNLDAPVSEPAETKSAPIVPVPVFELSKAPSFKKKVEPTYPNEAKQKEIEGVVQLEVLIDANGKVRKVKVLKSPGFGLERAAISALVKSQFNPGVSGGKAVAVKIKIPYRFVLSA